MNNRQNGRRRGRGGQRPQGMGSGGNSSRDTRQRGNAAQLLEKYKNMARDSQLAGDRVQTEYYLQFADHYFRVLGETRSRFEDQRPRNDDDDEGDEDEQFDAEGEEEVSERQERPARPQQQRYERRDRYERTDRQERNDRFEGDRPERAERQERDDRPERQERSDRPDRGERLARPERPRRERRPRDEDREEQVEQVNGIADFLPPAIGAVVSDEAEFVAENDEEAPRPRRRTRRPRSAEGSEEVVPAA